MTSKKHRRKGVGYMRVSSKRQEDEGHGLSSQEARCREYAKYKDIEIIAIFKESQSGSLSPELAIAEGHPGPL
mgnify:CR=1 FL=1